jgi:putative addiction module component (TIGR02574 family)
LTTQRDFCTIGLEALLVPNLKAVLAEATQLPVADRIQLIDALWDTVPEDSLPALTEDWLNEIRRRSADFDAGRANAIPWEQVRSEALRRAGLTVPDVAR